MISGGLCCLENKAMVKNIIVIGAGTAGLTAAVSAARSGANVTVLEAQERPGRKLLVTGNARCNLSNTAENLFEQYRGTGAALASRLLREFDAQATLDFFHGLGLLTQVKNGYIYPYTAQSSSVLEVLLAELRRWKVKLKFSQDITEILDLGLSESLEHVDKDKNNRSAHQRGQTTIDMEHCQRSMARFAVVTPTWTYHADAVILACGSKAAPSTGASEKGYLLAQKLGHSIQKPCPALVPLTSNAPFLNRVAGVRCRAGVTLLRHSAPGDSIVKNCSAAGNAGKGGNISRQENVLLYEEIARDTGELQWTNYGVSGIVIFQLSRYMTFEINQKTKYALRIDFFPDYSDRELAELLTRRAEELAKEPVSVLLRGLLNEKLISVVLDQSMNPAGNNEDLKQEDIIHISRTMKAFYLPVTGTKSFDQAQICTGGVDCREITDNLESRLHSGLYFAGEMLDVDGPCGGYNLQWAWASGFLAGASASREAV